MQRGNSRIEHLLSLFSSAVCTVHSSPNALQVKGAEEKGKQRSDKDLCTVRSGIMQNSPRLDTVQIPLAGERGTHVRFVHPYMQCCSAVKSDRLSIGTWERVQK